MGTPFKMNGFSGFGNSPMKQTKGPKFGPGPKMPKDHPVTPPTEKESGKGTVRPRTTEDRVISAISGSWPWKAMMRLEKKVNPHNDELHKKLKPGKPTKKK
jgi:hypothetical protein